MQWLTATTVDGLQLPGLHWLPKKRQACVVYCHGMFSTVLDNLFARQAAEQLQKIGYGFLFGHNRGMGIISHIPTRQLAADGSNISKEQGTVYDCFADCTLDVNCWLQQAKALGYQEIILLGHSLGCNKLLYALAHNPDPMVSKIILASPPDLAGITKQQGQYAAMLAEANDNLVNNRGKALLSTPLWGRFPISSQTFLDLCTDCSLADIFPLRRKPEKFPVLAAIQQPVLAILGENDYIINSPEDDLAVLQTKAVCCQAFATATLTGSNHRYRNHEDIFAQTLCNWLS